MTLEIDVTYTDIKKGVRNSLHNCPIALAAKRAGLKDVVVDGYSIAISNLCRTLPQKVSTFVSKFDHGDKVEPFSFTIDL